VGGSDWGSSFDAFDAMEHAVTRPKARTRSRYHPNRALASRTLLMPTRSMPRSPSGRSAKTAAPELDASRLAPRLTLPLSGLAILGGRSVVPTHVMRAESIQRLCQISNLHEFAIPRSVFRGDDNVSVIHFKQFLHSASIALASHWMPRARSAVVEARLRLRVMAQRAGA
jgi:hypothetical protein